MEEMEKILTQIELGNKLLPPFLNIVVFTISCRKRCNVVRSMLVKN